WEPLAELATSKTAISDDVGPLPGAEPGAEEGRAAPTPAEWRCDPGIFPSTDEMLAVNNSEDLISAVMFPGHNAVLGAFSELRA
ncbi:hypothetical protein CF319_g8678, partial [Tilletia indica]